MGLIPMKARSSMAHSPRQLVKRKLGGNVIFIVVLAIVAVLILLGLGFMYLKRRKRQASGKYEQAEAEDATETRSNSHTMSSAPPVALRNDRTTRQSHPPPSSRNNRSSSGAAANGSSSTANVDRNTSVRSVMTLPAYRQTADTNEQVLGREGERDGIDVIVDLPTEEEQEALRDEEMESMYQIRVARRQQIDEQQQRRVERREARQRGDSVALAQIRARALAASNSNQIDELRQEMERAKDNRQRSVSSVSYHNVGLAQHDGTRVRANSNDSERMGLLSDAASIGLSQRDRAPSPMHRREASVTSLLSMDSDFPSPRLTRSITTGTSSHQAGSSPELVEADLGDESMPPPEYEDVSLVDGDESPLRRSVTSMDDAPPDYPGMLRRASNRSENGAPLNPAPTTRSNESSGDETPRRSARGVGGIPQLPSLRIGRLPRSLLNHRARFREKRMTRQLLTLRIQEAQHKSKRTSLVSISRGINDWSTK